MGHTTATATPGGATHQLMGWRLDPLDVHDLNRIVEASVLTGTRRVIASQNLHSAYLHERHEELQRFYALADHVRIDGMSLILLARFFGLPLTRAHRVTWLDWIWSLAGLCAERGWRIYYVGGRPGVADRAAGILRARHGELHIATGSGYFDATPGSAANDAMVEAINRFNPDVLMVGMGMPRQELWILENAASLNARVILPCGACFDYLAGDISTPPRWLGRVGLEWLYRLCSEPRRLAHRYLAEPWLLGFHVARRMLRHADAAESRTARYSEALEPGHGRSRSQKEERCSAGL